MGVHVHRRKKGQGGMERGEGEREGGREVHVQRKEEGMKREREGKREGGRKGGREEGRERRHWCLITAAHLYKLHYI